MKPCSTSISFLLGVHLVFAGVTLRAVGDEVRTTNSIRTRVTDDPAELPAPGVEFESLLPSGTQQPEPPMFDDWFVDDEELPPLDEELWIHGGSYLYAPEGDRLNWPCDEDHAHYDLLRLPEDWQEPLPLTGVREFLGADPICLRPGWRWLGCDGYAWEPRFVGFGSYQLFGLARKESGRRQDLIGHQLTLDLDLRLTGTERFHVQHRPIGPEQTGGSFYQFTDPSGYVDNSTAEPDRYWFEAELHSLIGPDWDPFAMLDVNLTAGRFVLDLHNQLLINDELVGAIVSKNTFLVNDLSNLNLQAIYGASDVSSIPGNDPELYALHASLDYRRIFYEATYAFVDHALDATRNAHYAAISRTALIGTSTVAIRGFAKWEDDGGFGEGQLVALEWQRVRAFEKQPCGIEQGVFYCNAFLSTAGWSSIAGANLNRLSLAFEVSPLVRMAATPTNVKTWAVAAGVQLFRHHEDESLIPEIAFEDQDGVPAVAAGLRWLRKTGPRTFLEVNGVVAGSKDRARRRDGIGMTHTTLF